MLTLNKRLRLDIFVLLPILVLGTDLMTPFLIWKKFLPAEVRWLSHFVIVIMILLTVLQALASRRIPGYFWIVLAVSLLWGYVAFGHNQGVASTLWGIWLLFQFPIIALFVYLQPKLPAKFPEFIRNFGLLILSMEVVFQVLQYFTGEPPGDDLAGFFGQNGTGNAVVFDILILCLWFGFWIISKQWLGMTLALIFGAVSSTLGEMKLFFFVVPAITLFAILFYAHRNRSLRKPILFIGLFVATFFGFVFLYNYVVPEAARFPLQGYLTNPARLWTYGTHSESYYTNEGLYTDIARIDAVEVGVESLKIDPITFLFGYGLGARSESRTFEIAGVGLTYGNLGLSVGTSLLIFMQEMGLVGLISLGSFLIWLVLRLIHDIRRNPFSPAIELRYGLLLFTLSWPIWIFYTNVWTMRVPMFIYWLTVGYVFAENRLTMQKNSNPSLEQQSVAASMQEVELLAERSAD